MTTDTTTDTTDTIDTKDTNTGGSYFQSFDMPINF